jgi:hypothetical protein
LAASADSYRLKFGVVDFDCPVGHKTNCTVAEVLLPRTVGPGQRLSRDYLFPQPARRVRFPNLAVPLSFNVNYQRDSQMWIVKGVFVGFGLFLAGLFLTALVGITWAVTRGQVQTGHATGLSVVYAFLLGSAWLHTHRNCRGRKLANSGSLVSVFPTTFLVLSRLWPSLLPIRSSSSIPPGLAMLRLRTQRRRWNCESLFDNFYTVCRRSEHTPDLGIRSPQNSGV